MGHVEGVLQATMCNGGLDGLTPRQAMGVVDDQSVVIYWPIT